MEVLIGILVVAVVGVIAYFSGAGREKYKGQLREAEKDLALAAELDNLDDQVKEDLDAAERIPDRRDRLLAVHDVLRAVLDSTDGREQPDDPD